MVTVWSGSEQSRRACLVFLTLVCVAFSVPVFALAWLPVGPHIIGRLFAVNDQAIATIVLYLRFASPVLILQGWRQYIAGLLIRRKCTGWVVTLRSLDLVLVAAVLAVGVAAGGRPALVVGSAFLIPPIAGILTAWWLLCRGTTPNNSEQTVDVTFAQLWTYFLPLAGTTFLFTLSRPIIFRFVQALNPTQDPNGVDTTMMIAALSLAFNVGLVFQIIVNQFRHLFVTYGHEDPAGVRRFMRTVTALVTALMLAVLVTPLARLFLHHCQGAEGETLQMALDCLWMLVLAPVAIAWRNYYHGLAMIHRRTGAMALGGLARNGAILAVGIVLLSAGLLTHQTAAMLLLLAFIAEGSAVAVCTRSWRTAVLA